MARAGRRGPSAVALVHVLPLEQEPHEVGRTHRLDLRAQPVERVAMDAREQRAGRTIRAPCRASRSARRQMSRMRTDGAAPSARERRERPRSYDAFRTRARAARRRRRRRDAASREPGRAVTGPSMVSRPRTISTTASTRPRAGARLRGRVDDGIEVRVDGPPAIPATVRPRPQADVADQ